MIVLGLRLRDLGSPGFNWRDLLVIVRFAGRETRLYAALNPDDDPLWSMDTYLLAQIADLLHIRLWQAGGGKGVKPKPIPRPGEVKTHKGDVMSMEDMREFLGWD